MMVADAMWVPGTTRCRWSGTPRTDRDSRPSSSQVKAHGLVPGTSGNRDRRHWEPCSLPKGGTGACTVVRLLGVDRHSRHQWSPWRRAGIFGPTEIRTCQHCAATRTRRDRQPGPAPESSGMPSVVEVPQAD